ncbi:hypothetical protein HU200_026965 [Digitaria exilis]|uniref:Uncharacterized protein n=1 Tax=Digitaria exilis TaxID=1010633 RepID=A0A835BXM5_9POAL|nr:hypothetical protein HU200_026965 [Digitaria exilis]
MGPPFVNIPDHAYHITSCSSPLISGQTPVPGEEVVQADPDTTSACQSPCKNVDTPYPFGLGQYCAINLDFNLKCDFVEAEMYFQQHECLLLFEEINSHCIISPCRPSWSTKVALVGVTADFPIVSAVTSLQRSPTWVPPSWL